MLDGARGPQPELMLACAEAKRLLSGSGWSVEEAVLREMPIASCRGCFGCWVRTPGECVIDDAGRDVARSVAHSDLVVMLTPITFGGYSSELKKAVDRVIPNALPFFTTVDGITRHTLRYERRQRLIAIGLLGKPSDAAEGVFRALVRHNAANFHSPGHAAAVVRAGAEETEVASAVRGALRDAGVAP